LEEKKYPELLKLKGKITEEKETIGSLADKMGLDRNTVANKIKGKTAFDLVEMYEVAEILNIRSDEITDYFFINNSHNAKK